MVYLMLGSVRSVEPQKNQMYRITDAQKRVPTKPTWRPP